MQLEVKIRAEMQLTHIEALQKLWTVTHMDPQLDIPEKN